jgi:hypothetical protein
MLPAEFEPAILASRRPQNHALDRAATWVGPLHMYRYHKLKSHKQSVTSLIHVINTSVQQFEHCRFKTSLREGVSI